MSRIRTRLLESLPLLLLAMVCAALLALAHGWSAPRIAVKREQLHLQVLADILPTGVDVASLGRGRLFSAPALLGSDEPVRVHRLQGGGRWLGALIEIRSHDGYRGDILLGVVIDEYGRVIGVRALAQHETRGLGDGIDYRISPWMDQFRGRGPAPGTDWRLRRAGGAIDQLSGATVTSRAVLRAVYACVRLFHEYRDLFRDWPQPGCPQLNGARSVCP